MRLTRLGSAAAAGVAAVVLAAGVGPVAHAAVPLPTIPGGQTLYGIHQADATSYLITLDSTGEPTIVADMGQRFDAWAADWDPTTGQAYFVDQSDGCALYALNLTTGQSTLVGMIPVVGRCLGFDIDDAGVMRVLDPESYLYVINKSTAAIESTVETYDNEGNRIPDWSALSSRADGSLVGVNWYGDHFAIDPATGIVESLMWELVPSVEATDFDANGRLWGITYDELDGSCDTTLYSTDLTAENGASLQGDIGSVDAECLNTWAIFFASAATNTPTPTPSDPADPELADSGFESVLGWTAGAMLLLAGLILTALRRRAVAD